VALAAAPAEAQMRIGSGQYTGNGADNRPIVVGFQPDVVLVKRDGAFDGVVRTSTMTGDLTKSVDLLGAAAFANGVQSLSTTGFVLGNDARVNALGAPYYWVAWKAAAGEMAVGSYLGDDVDNRDITTVGFQPDYVWVLPQEAFFPVQRTSSMAGDLSHDFDAWGQAGWIRALVATGFRVSDAAPVNGSSGSGLYHYVAWKNTAGRISVGSYTGDGAFTRDLDILTFQPEWVVVKRSGGARPFVHKPWATGPYTDYNLYFTDFAGNGGDIKQLRPLGFQVENTPDGGSGDRANEPGVTYYYVAMGPHAAPSCCELATTQVGGVVTVETSEARMVWEETGQGGGLSELYAKNEPSPTVNRASDELAYNLVSTQVNDNTPAPNTWHFEDGGSGRVDVLEATPTRVRLRQRYNFTSSIHLQRDFTVHGYPRLAYREDLTLDSAQSIRGAQGIHAAAPAACPSAGAFYCYGRPNPSPVNPPPIPLVNLTTDDAATYSDMLGIPYTTPFFGRGGGANGEFQASWEDHDPGAPYTLFSRVWEGTQIATASGTETRFNLFYPMLAGLTSTGSEYQPYADDYRTASNAGTLSVSVGSGWFDTAAENTTAPDDFFNEAESGYSLTAHATNGLTFQLTGSGPAPRRRPFFKIRNWRSLASPAVVKLNGATLTRDVDYRSAVKPVSRASFLKKILWYSTLQNGFAIGPLPDYPDVGNPGTPTGVGYVAARHGQGMQVGADGQYVAVGVTDGAGAALPDFDKAQGAFEFWFQPTWASNDGVRHDLAGVQADASNLMAFQKLAANTLRFQIVFGGTIANCTVAAASYSWAAGEWVHLRVEWDDAAPQASQQRVYVNGALKACAPATDYNAAALALGVSAQLRVGDINNANAAFGAGIYDELYIYGGSAAPVTLLAEGGLTASANESLADAAKDFQMTFVQRDGLVRGEYLYLGADTPFSGLGVLLAIAGVSGDAALRFQYWSGFRWNYFGQINVGSATAGFTDTTNALTQNGVIHWDDSTLTSGPMQPYSAHGGPDLYYIRIFMQFGSYATPPTERQVKTDIALLQYCGDISAPGQEFQVQAPPPTAVMLQSFSATAEDAAVRLEWRTASELDNLGFHLYRAPSAGGPWERLNPSLIPGLGSSPVGQAYSYRDAGLTNGTRYFYRLEDVDAHSKTTAHGPVSAVPQAAAGAGASAAGSEGPAAAGAGGKQKGAAAATCPDWVLAAYGSAVGADPVAASLRCTRHGDPEAVSLGVVSRDARSATLELRTGGFYALHAPGGDGRQDTRAAGSVRVFVPGFDFPRDEKALALPVRRALTDAVVGRRVRLGGVRALEVVGFRGLMPAALGKAYMQVDRDGTVRAARRGSGSDSPRQPRAEIATLLPSLFQGERKSAVVEIRPLRFDAERQQLVLAKRVLVRLVFTGRETGELGRGSLGRAPRSRTPAREVLARLHSARPGLHAVGFEQLLPGRARGIAASELRLERQGTAAAFHIEPSAASFGPGSVLYFYAATAARSTDFSSETVWELVRSAAGLRMPVVSAPAGAPPAASGSTRTVVFEGDRYYQPGLLDAPDLWLWGGMPSGARLSKGFALAGVDAAPSREAVVDVFLQGASESGQPVDHHVSVLVNGVPAGEVQFAGKRAQRTRLSLPASLLREGANELSLTNVADTGVSSYVFLDRFSVSYPQAAAAAAGQFEGTWEEAGTVGVVGVAEPAVVLDVTGAAEETDGAGPAAWLAGFTTRGGELRFRAEAGRRYLVVSPEALVSPRVTRPQPSTLRSATQQADYLLVAPRAFLPAAEPLLRRRSDQGLAAHAVAFEEIADEFGHGRPSAEAIRSFLAYAFHSWARPSPRYVLLVGDSSYDPRNFSGSSRPSPLPALWTRTSYLWTVSDPELAAVNGADSLPDLAIGRLPATTVEEAERLVTKQLAWEDSGQDLDGPAALVADNPDAAGDFEADVDDIGRSFLQDRELRALKLSELGGAMRPAIREAFDAGLGLVSYVGHGGVAVWASENVWGSQDAASLQAQSRQPLLLTLNCLNGYFVAPAYDSLAESLLKAEGRGAIAAISPSGLSVDGPAHQYHRALVAELTRGRHGRLGDAVLAAQKAYAESGLMPELVSVYQLLGDPALPIR
jgi:hypothetical protein